MMNVVERALVNIFEPMTQNERSSHIRFLVTHFESTPSEHEATPSVGKKVASSKGVARGGKRGGLPFYIKSIVGIDETKAGGFCFLGEFIQPSKIDDVGYGAPILIGTKTSPKKYCLAKVNPELSLVFHDADGREINVSGAEMISIHTDVKELIDTIKRLALLKS